MKRATAVLSLLSTLGISLLSGEMVQPAAAVEYRGQRLDGRSFAAIALATDSDQPQQVNVTFDGYQALLHFEDGNYAIVELEDVVIQDRDNIKAMDRRQNIEWKLDLH